MLGVDVAMRVERRGGSWHVVEGRGADAASESGPLASEAAARDWLRDFERSHQFSLHDEQCQTTALDRAREHRGDDGWSGGAASDMDDSSEMRWQELLASAAAIADGDCVCGRTLSRRRSRV